MEFVRNASVGNGVGRASVGEAASRGVRDKPANEGPRRATEGAEHDHAEVVPMLLTADEAAVLLRTTRKAVYALLERGQLAGVRRLGRRVLIHREELLDSLCEKRASPPGR
jgi:excisionase family DNA binding protein